VGKWLGFMTASCLLRGRRCLIRRVPGALPSPQAVSGAPHGRCRWLRRVLVRHGNAPGLQAPMAYAPGQARLPGALEAHFQETPGARTLSPPA